MLPGARGLLTSVARAVLAAEAAGIASETTEQAAEYAKVRQQFGRPIATFQAVKHHCANMLVAAELAAAASWDAGRAWISGGDQLSYTAAIAATLAVPAAVSNASLNIQVHGGIGFTWEHDAHLYLRRAAAIAAVVDAEQAAIDVTDLVRGGVRRAAAIDLPAEAEPIRAAIRPDVARLRDLTGDGQEAGADRDRLRDAALAEAVGPGRVRRRAAGDRAGVRRGRDQAAWLSASPAGSS